jgi:hypothetical protein
MDSSQQGVSFFRVVLIGLLLASVWVVARRFTGQETDIHQSAEVEKKPSLTFNGRPVSLAGRIQDSLPVTPKPELASDSKGSHSKNSHSKNSEQSYIDFLESVANSMPSFEGRSPKDIRDEPAQDLPQDRLDDLRHDPVIAPSGPSAPLDGGPSMDTTDVPASDPVEDDLAVSIDELGMKDEVKPKSLMISEVESVVQFHGDSSQAETIQPELMLPESVLPESLLPESTPAEGLVQPNPFANPGSNEFAAQRPNRSLNQNHQVQAPTSPSDRKLVEARGHIPPSVNTPADRRTVEVVSEGTITSGVQDHSDQRNLGATRTPASRVAIETGASHRRDLRYRKSNLFSKVHAPCFLPKKNKNGARSDR